MLPRIVERPARAMAQSLFDRGAGIPEERLRWTLDDLDDFLWRAGHKTRTLFLVGLILLEWVFPLLYLRRARRMSSLSPPDRVRYLQRVDQTLFSGLIALVKAMLSLIYFEHPDALAETGYDGLPRIVRPTRQE